MATPIAGSGGSITTLDGKPFNLLLFDAVSIDHGTLTVPLPTTFPLGSLRYTGHEPFIGGNVTLNFTMHWDSVRQINDLCFNLGRGSATFGLPRDWSMPDAWHRGYLRGRLERWKAQQAETRAALANV